VRERTVCVVCDACVRDRKRQTDLVCVYSCMCVYVCVRMCACVCACVAITCSSLMIGALSASSGCLTTASARLCVCV